MVDAVKFMRSQAEYFAPEARKWLYDSNTPSLHKVVRQEDRLSWSLVRARIKDAYEWMFHYPDFARSMDKFMPQRMRRFLQPLAMAWYSLTHVERNLPDGQVGSNYTYWMEDGLYIMMMRPSVGSLVADFLEQDPTNPHAQAIRAEMESILADFDQVRKERRETQS